MAADRILEDLARIAEQGERSFKEERRLLSFREYLALFATDPLRHSRDAARYTRDMFDYFGRVPSERPWGNLTRFRLFDLPFLDEGDRQREALVGQEAVQLELYRALNNFVREGRPNRVLMLHGPNGSAKSTVAACLMRALEHYSSEAEGALYRFHWVFPSRSTLRGSIGFGDGADRASDTASYAHLPEDKIDSRLFVEVRDHPLFLLPHVQRQELLHRVCESQGLTEPLTHRIYRGEMSHKNKEVFEALLSSYEG